MPTIGTLAFDIAHLFGGAMLTLSFALLYQRRIGAVIRIFALQSATLAAAAAWQAHVQGEPHLYLTALIALGAKAIVLPLALRRLVVRLALHRDIETALDVGATLILGVGLVALAILVVLPVTAGLPGGPLAREDLAIALSVILLGLLMMVTRRNAITQMVGFMSVENGLILAAVGAAGMPLVLELAVAALVLVAFLVFGVVFSGIRERFDRFDTALLDRAGGEK